MKGLIAELQHEYDEHCPWSYTEFGTICSCGRAIIDSVAEECSLQIQIRKLIEEIDS